MQNNIMMLSFSNKVFLLPLLICLSPASANASAAYQNYIYGDVKDITSVRGALMVRIDDDKVPTVCSSAGSSWMRIEQTETAMTSVVLSYWLQGKKKFTFYSDGLSSGYCSINQVDPEA